MAFKRDLTEEERYGLSEEEIKLATKWLRKHKTAGVLNDIDSAQLFELFLLGVTLGKIADQYPQHTLGKICLTAALKGWVKDRDRMMCTLQDKVRAKVLKSVIDQVDFLSALLAVSNAEHIDAMRKYILDPANNAAPTLRIKTIKEYKEVAETLYKLIVSSNNSSGGRGSALGTALSGGPRSTEPAKELSAAQLIAESMNEPSEPSEPEEPEDSDEQHE
jgi:hypothetical protein